jgi:hypothetical protein
VSAVTGTSSAGAKLESPGRPDLPRRSLPAARKALPTSAELVRFAAPAVIGLAALTLVWSRLIVLGQGFWGDEAFSVSRYINHGPGAIWDPAQWIPNNHVLFEALTWVTTGIIRSHIEAAERIWSVFPAMAGAGLLGFWLWRRFDRWAAAVFAVLATAAPLYFDLGSQARGYGLGFLAGAAIVVAADRVIRTGSPSSLILFGLSGFIGMATLQNFVAPFVAAAAVIMLVPARRRQTIVTVLVTGVATAVWYAPLLSKIIGYSNPYGRSLAWDGFIVAPLRDLFGQGVHSLWPGVPVTVAAVLAGVLLAVGAMVLWRRHERLLILLFLVPTAATYLLIEVAATYSPRFASFAFLPLLALAAIAIAAVGRVMGRVRALAPVALVLFIVGSLLVLGRFVGFASGYARVPFEAAQTTGAIIRGIAGPNAQLPIVTNYALQAFGLYARPREVSGPGAAQLEQTFCTFPGKFVYIEQELFLPHPSTTCLITRGAFRIALPERRSRLRVWLVPPLSRATPRQP